MNLRKKRCIVGTFTHGQGDKTLLGELVFSTVRNENFRGDLHLDVPQALVMMHGEILHRTTRTGTYYVGSPTVFGETFRYAGCEGERRIAPEKVLMVAVDVLLVDKGANGIFFRIVGLPKQKPWYGQPNVPSVLRLPEGLPLGVAGAAENILQILERGQTLKTGQPKKDGPAAAMKGAWAMAETLAKLCSRRMSMAEGSK